MNFEKSAIQNQLTAWLLRKTATSGVRRVASLAAAIASEIGSVRNENQDRAIIARGGDRQGREYAILAVADGIGGMRDGATCAAIALGTFLAAIDQAALLGAEAPSNEWIERAVNASNEAVFAKFRGDGGSTLVALLVRPGHPVFWLSVGDSRVYSSNGKHLTQISVDDTIAGQLGKHVDTGSDQSKLLQFIGMGVELEPHVSRIDGGNVEALILTTDGIHFLAPAPDWLGQVVEHAPDPGVCVKRLVDLAKWCGGPDNATAAMISMLPEYELGERPTYRCLEVWDAFGDLQIIPSVTGQEEYTRHQPPPVIRQSSGSVAGALVPVVPTTIENSNLPKQEKEPSKTRRSKKTQKTKNLGAKKNKTASKSDKSPMPQLLMEFPKKSG